MKKKSIQVIMVAAIVLLLGFSVYNLVSVLHIVRARHVSHDLYAIVDQVDHQPPSIERASEFVQKLHSINTDYAPIEVKQALKDYTAAVEQSLAAWKANGDISAYDNKIREQSLRLKASLKKYE